MMRCFSGRLAQQAPFFQVLGHGIGDNGRDAQQIDLFLQLLGNLRGDEGVVGAGEYQMLNPLHSNIVQIQLNHRIGDVAT